VGESQLERYTRMLKEDPTTVYTPGFHKKFAAPKYRPWCIAITRDFVERHQIKSLVDFGCGVGSHLEGALAGGATIKGYELSFEASKRYTPTNVLPFIEYGDVTKTMDVGKFDAVFSVEVAEHIPPDTSDQFAANLTKAAERFIVITAAPPGQKGKCHINCRPREFWIELICRHGWVYDDDETKKTRESWLPYGPKAYILRNLMIFRKGSFS